MLSSRLGEIERQCWANYQYSRRKILEVIGLPKSLPNNPGGGGGGNVCEIFVKQSCSIAKDDLDARHWLKGKERVIVKFFKRNDSKQEHTL